MIRKRPSSYCYYYYFFRTRRAITTCTLPLDPPNASVSTIGNDHKSLCFSLAEQLIQRGLLTSAQQVVRRIITHSLSVSDSFSALDFAAARGLDLGLGTYGALIRKLVSSAQPQLAEALFRDSIVGRGIDPDLSILNSMVICFCMLGKLEEAIAQFDRLLEMGCMPCRAACNAMLRELYAQDRILETFDYLIRVNEGGVNLSFSFFNKLIDGLCYKGYVDEALELFDVMRSACGYQPTLHLYKSLFYGLCKRGLVVEAESLFREMESQGLYIDRVMYTSLINQYCKDKKMKMAMQVFLRMLKTDCEPDNYTYNTLIHGFLKLGLFDKGWLVYKQMAGWGIQPDAVTNHLFISKYCREGKVDCALMLLNNNLSCNLAPNVHCYTVLIDALYKENRLLEVHDLFKSMLVRGVVP